MPLRHTWTRILLVACGLAVCGCSTPRGGLPLGFRRSQPTPVEQPTLSVDQELDATLDQEGEASSESAPPFWKRMFPARSATPARHTPRSVDSPELSAKQKTQKKSDDDEFKSQFALARLCERRGQPEQAIAIYQTLIARSPERAETHHRLGVLAAQRDEMEAAQQHFATARKLAPQNVELLSDIGYAYYLEHRWPEAEQALREATKLKPDYAPARVNLGLVMGAQGQFDASLAEFQRAGTEAQAHANLAYVYSQAGQLEKAHQHFNRALTLDSSMRPAAEALVQIAQAQNSVHNATIASASAEARGTPAVAASQLPEGGTPAAPATAAGPSPQRAADTAASSALSPTGAHPVATAPSTTADRREPLGPKPPPTIAIVTADSRSKTHGEKPTPTPPAVASAAASPIPAAAPMAKAATPNPHPIVPPTAATVANRVPTPTATPTKTPVATWIPAPPVMPTTDPSTVATKAPTPATSNPVAPPRSAVATRPAVSLQQPSTLARDLSPRRPSVATELEPPLPSDRAKSLPSPAAPAKSYANTGVPPYRIPELDVPAVNNRSQQPHETAVTAKSDPVSSTGRTQPIPTAANVPEASAVSPANYVPQQVPAAASSPLERKRATVRISDDSPESSDTGWSFFGLGRSGLNRVPDLSRIWHPLGYQRAERGGSSHPTAQPTWRASQQSAVSYPQATIPRVLPSEMEQSERPTSR